MKIIKRILFVFIISTSACLYSCIDHEQVSPDSYIHYPSYFPDPIPFPHNPLSSKGIALGKMLFFDPILSKDSSISCASCHHPEFAFSDAGNVLSSGVEGRKGFRNSPTLANLAWKPLFFHDGGANSLENQAISPIIDPLEMDHPLQELLKKLNQSSTYPPLFKEAFGTDEIRTRELTFALAQFQRTLVTTNSTYDLYLQGKTQLSSLELKGLTLFEQKCASCHTPPLFTNFEFVNNGLDSQFPSLETESNHFGLGRARVTQKDGDIGKYMVPTLRNISVTSPYMHDGRFNDLEAVLDHYDKGIKASNTLDNRLASGIPLDGEDRKALIAFLHTLTDIEFLHLRR